MKKVLYIVGSTATGKTNQALLLAEKYNANLISADSRQVYKYMDIGTGKDIPKGFKQKKINVKSNIYTTYQKGNLTIWGYDFVLPSQDFSIALYKRLIDPIIKYLHENNILPIIVGGTGLYANVIENPPASLSIPINQTLRSNLANHSVEQLQACLRKADSKKYNAMNHSDINNKRRLIRAIEIANNPAKKIIKSKRYNSLWIGLTANQKDIEKSIKNRVKQRVDNGFAKEFKFLIKEKLLIKDSQAASATGYKQWFEYYQGKISQDEAIKKWIFAEKQYAKRQQTWFKKQDQIVWFDTNQKGARESVVQKVKNWYS
jgi:tRNA dimethylallyltransferase